MDNKKPRGAWKVYDNVFFVRGELYDLYNGILRDSLKGSNKVTHLWYFEVKTGVYQHLLSSEEQEKALGYMFQGDLQRFVFSRGMLRVLLGYYLNKDPEKIPLKTDEDGKTVLMEAPQLRFSLSHTGDVVAYVFTNVGDVGVDVERPRDVVNMEIIAEKFFLTRDLEIFLQTSIYGRRKLFFRAWTAREACFKAYGGNLDEYWVTFEEGDTRFINVVRKDVRLPGRIHQFFINDHCFSVVS